MPTNNHSVSTISSNFLTRTRKIKGICKSTYFGETDIHNYIIPTTFSPYSLKRIGLRFPTPFTLFIFKHCWTANCLCVLQILAIKWFGKIDIFSTMTTQKLEKNAHTEIQKSLVQAHTRPSPYQGNLALVPGKERKMPSVPMPGPDLWGKQKAQESCVSYSSQEAL